MRSAVNAEISVFPPKARETVEWETPVRLAMSLIVIGIGMTFCTRVHQLSIVYTNLKKSQDINERILAKYLKMLYYIHNVS
jgi:hypothetical protein